MTMSGIAWKASRERAATTDFRQKICKKFLTGAGKVIKYLRFY